MMANQQVATWLSKPFFSSKQLRSLRQHEAMSFHLSDSPVRLTQRKGVMVSGHLERGSQYNVPWLRGLGPRYSVERPPELEKKKLNIGARKMVQSIKRLPCKHEGLGSVSRSYTEAWCSSRHMNPSIGEVMTGGALELTGKSARPNNELQVQWKILSCPSQNK